MIPRFLNLFKILGNNRSAFLFGPRGVGKTVLSKEFARNSQPSFEIDLLDSESYARYLTSPALFRKEVELKIEQDR